MINARAETVGEKPSFRTVIRRRRCLVLADGFYEWQRTGGTKRPMRVVMRSGDPFTFAWLWSVWKDQDGNRVPSCTFITSEANELLHPIHGRMSVILQRQQEDLWLDGGVEGPGALSGVLAPFDAETMEAHEASTLVNSAASNHPEFIARIA